MKKLMIWLALCLLTLPAAARADYVTLRSGDGSDLVRVETDDPDVTVTEWTLIVETGEDGVIADMYFCADVRNDGYWVVPLGEATVVTKDGREYKKVYGEYAHGYYIPEGGAAYYSERIFGGSWNWMPEAPRGVTLDSLERVTIGLLDTLDGTQVDYAYLAEALWDGVEAKVERLSPRWVNGERWETLRVTVENHSGEDMNPGVSIGAYDAQGRLICAVSEDLDVRFGKDSLLFPDGSSFVIDLCVDDGMRFNVLDYLTRTGVEVAEYRVRLY